MSPAFAGAGSGWPFDKLRTGEVRLPSVIDAREGSQGSARGGCQQNRAGVLRQAQDRLEDAIALNGC